MEYIGKNIIVKDYVPQPESLNKRTTGLIGKVIAENEREVFVKYKEREGVYNIDKNDVEVVDNESKKEDNMNYSKEIKDLLDGYLSESRKMFEDYKKTIADNLEEYKNNSDAILKSARERISKIELEEEDIEVNEVRLFNGENVVWSYDKHIITNVNRDKEPYKLYELDSNNLLNRSTSMSHLVKMAQEIEDIEKEDVKEDEQLKQPKEVSKNLEPMEIEDEASYRLFVEDSVKIAKKELELGKIESFEEFEVVFDTVAQLLDKNEYVNNFVSKDELNLDYKLIILEEIEKLYDIKVDDLPINESEEELDEEIEEENSKDSKLKNINLEDLDIWTTTY